MRVGFSVSKRSGGGIGGNIIFSLFGLLFAIFGSMAVLQEFRDLGKIKAMQEWPRVECVIDACKSDDDGEEFILRLSYSYSVNGRAFTSSRHSHDENLTAEDIATIKAAEKRFTKGTETSCHYDPANPADSVLVLPTIKDGQSSFSLSFLIPAVGLFFAAIPWLMNGKRKKDDSANNSGIKIFLIIFGSLFTTVGIAMIKPVLITPIQKTRDAKTWTPVTARVVSSKVKSHRGDNGTTYSPYIAYRYEITGEEYFGDQYTFMQSSSSGRDSKAKIVRQYPRGRVFTIYVNPSNPTESVITRAAGASMFIGLLPILFTAVGLGVMIWGFRIKKPALDPSQSRDRVVALKRAPIGAKTIGLAFLTTIWLAVVYFLAISDAPRMFPILFGIFGVILFGASIHSALSLTNPRPTAEITPGAIHPGTEVALRWRLSGQAEKLRSMRVMLECQRVITTHGSDGDSKVVKNTIFSKELLNPDRQLDITHGALTFKIPDNQPASRPGYDDGIEWRLTFHGDIPRWPDMKEELPFIVYPQSSPTHPGAM